ncbi:MAG: carbon storage regulator CsrA [Planctomycetia bacterium]|nr:carbon storage regulator CsrA [Planctomycetia bacterium]
MLVLSRYKDQSIYIGDDVIVTIVDVRGDRIRLGIEAPANVPVHRQEIYEAIQRENARRPEEKSPRRSGGARGGNNADYELDFNVR